MLIGSKQLLLITGVCLLTVALYFAPKVINKEVANDNNDLKVYSFETLISEAKGLLKRQEAERINSIETALKSDPSSLVLFDSLGKMWDRVNMPQISAHYYEKIALIKSDESSWINAAYRYYDAFRMTSDTSLRKVLVDKAISSYQKVLEKNPENLDAKTDLGLCYAEGTNSPMQGIMLLREVVAKNPNHEMAQFNLGILSVKSQQYDKAVERFQHVLEINSANKEARFMLARTYSAMGNKEQALKNLKMIRETEDSRLNEEVNNLINQINNN